MKICFLYYERWKNEHADPFLRVSLKELGIDLIPISCPSNPGRPEQLWPNFDDTHRRQVVDDIFNKLPSCDAVLIHHRCLSPNMLRSKRPLIILEHTDGTQLEISRNFLHLPQILGVIKGTVFRKLEFYNEPCCEGMFHGKIMSNTCDMCKPSALPLSLLGKIELGYSFGCFPSNKRFLLAREEDRKISISFVGATHYHRSRLVTIHRQLAVSVCRKIPDSLVIEHQITQAQFDSILYSSKLCLSPYGYGVCYRSFESLYAGCLCVSPPSDFMVSWPDIYTPNSAYFGCKADFSDLHEVVDDLLAKYEDMAELRYCNRQLLLDTYWNEEKLASHLGGILQRCINRL